MNKKMKKTTGTDYFLMGLLSLGFIAFDMLMLVMDQYLFPNVDTSSFKSFTANMQMIHWSMVILIWALGTVYLIHWAKKHSDKNQIINMSLSSKVIKYIILSIILSLIFVAFENLLEPSVFPQIYNEFLNFTERFGSQGILLSIFQNIYYLFEGILMFLIIALMQMAGETWFKNKTLPYGSIGLLITWGIGHIFSKDLMVGLWAMVFSLFAGVIYIISKKNLWATGLFIILMFIL